MPHKGLPTVVCFLLFFLTASGSKAVSNFCPSGTCDITNPIYINVYWDSSENQWNVDIAASDASATVSRIDALTKAVCHSAYFSQLTQYSVVSCTTRASIVENGCGPPPPDIDQAHNGIGTFASCVVASHSGIDTSRTILNVFLPPQTRPASPNSDFCKQSNGQHDKYGSPLAVTFIPTNSACNGSIAGILGTLTHEMVEATTDPVPQSPTGWKVAFGDEVADQCERLPGRFTSFLFGSVSSYFSDQANACTNGISSAVPFTPVISSIAACGSGRRARISILGDLGTAPWDLASDVSGSKTLFLQVAVSGSHQFSAGGIENFPPDLVGLGPVAWKHLQSNDSVVIAGLDQKYGTGLPQNQGSIAAIAPGDQITVKLSSWLSGQSATGTVTIPGPTAVQKLSVTRDEFAHPPIPIYINDVTTISGQVVGSSGCPIGGVEVQLAASDSAPNVLYPTSSRTADDGTFSAQYTPKGAAGTHTVSILSPVASNIPVPVHPEVDYLSQTLGVTGGGQAVTLYGDGFAASGTTIEFRGPGGTAQAAGVSVPDAQTVHFSTPASPLTNHGSGIVKVVANVKGQESIALAYRYMIPNQPVLTFSAACGPVGNQINDFVEVDAYNADGSTATEQVALSAAYPAFESNGQTVSNLNVSPGANIQVKGAGPITATPSSDPQLAVTRKIPAGLEPPSACVTPGSKYKLAVISYVPGPGPVESLVAQALTGIDKQSVAWSNAAAPEDATAYIALTGVDAATVSAAKSMQVRSLGSRELLLAANQFGFGLMRDVSGLQPARLLGPNFSTGAAAPGTTAPRMQALISFLLPAAGEAKQYSILRLDPAADSWVEIPSVVANSSGRTFIRSKISGAGIYALARIEPARSAGRKEAALRK